MPGTGDSKFDIECAFCSRGQFKAEDGRLLGGGDSMLGPVMGRRQQCTERREQPAVTVALLRLIFCPLRSPSTLNHHMFQ